MPEPLHHIAHEPSGINTRGVGIFIAIFIPSTLLILTLIWLLYGGLTHHLVQSEVSPNPLAQNLATPLDQTLQPSPDHPTLDWQDLTALKSAQNQQLNSYGPLPNDPAHAHIPISRAMQLLLQNQTLETSTPAPATQPYINTTQPTPTENRT